MAEVRETWMEEASCSSTLALVEMLDSCGSTPWSRPSLGASLAGPGAQAQQKPTGAAGPAGAVLACAGVTGTWPGA